MIQKFSIFLCMFYCIAYDTKAQEDFQPSGDPYAKIFFDFHSDFEGTDPAFDINRAYFGYEHHFSPEFTGDITLDVGESRISINDSTSLSSSLQLTAYLKQASLAYNTGNFLVEAGMIGLKQFKIQENAWGYRYVEKSFQDLYGMGPSADMGFLVQYDFSKMLSADFTMRNGEGYKKLQTDNDFNYGAGITFSPIDGLILRGWYDYMTGEIAQYTLAHFIGYENEKISLGAEYNAQFNHQNAEEMNLRGYSFYASYSLNERISVFGRFDELKSNTPEGYLHPWNYEDDGNLIITGVEYTSSENMKVALNYQGWKANEEQTSNYMYLNFQFVF